MKENEKTCIHCNAAFEMEEGLGGEEKKYCGYCRAVILSCPDSSWIPEIKDGEKLPRGFNTIEMGEQMIQPMNFDEALEEIDEEINETLNRQMREGLSYITKAESRIKKLSHCDEWIEWKISDMKRYVKQYKWLPTSYMNMLREWQLPNFS